MKLSARGFALTFTLVLGSVAACGGGGSSGDPDATQVDAPPVIDAPMIDGRLPPDASISIPAFRNPVAMGDLALARAAGARLGIGTAKACDQCHALTRETFANWLVDTRAADACFTTLTPTSDVQAKGIMDCFRSATGQPYSPHRLGIYATGASLGWFNAVVQLAYGSGWATEWAQWTGRVLMPRGGAELFTQAEFDLVAEWFARGLPELEAVLNDLPPPDGCTQDIQPEVATHVAAMQTAGWTAVNLAAGINMFGCQGATTPLECLATFPLSTTNTWSAAWGTAAPSTKLRILHPYNYGSSFWTRSSADGRFVAHGGGPGGSTVIDLQTNREIPADANYDPGFFPDNSGFVIQGGAKAWCRQSLLTSNPTQITFNEPQCTNLSVIGLYQHIGAVAGGDYWAVNGQFVSDNGGGEPSANFSSSNTNNLTPMIWNGTNYVARQSTQVPMPFEGDTVISSTAKLLISRTTFQGAQSGFTLRKLSATLNGNRYDVSAPVIGRYCVSGGKPGFSYDDRWITYHHYVQSSEWQSMGYPSQSDPAFQALVNANTANVFLLDITNGVARRITNMNAGQRALFPHFRSDGWIYFIVKGGITGHTETVVASDAALVYE